MNIKRLKGFRDILPSETPAWRMVEESAARVFGKYGYEELRLPLLEETPLFKRTIGEATDIVEKEMYTFTDAGDNMVTLRPEGTASTVRAYVENGFARSHPKERWYYMGPMFRRERPQKGRFRQFHQIGAECFGWAEPAADADVISMLWDFTVDVGISSRVSLEVNSLGCASDRSVYVEELRKYLLTRSESLCGNCQERTQRNPLRVLDCKNPNCQEATKDAPALESYLCEDCSEHFTSVCGILSSEKVPFKVNNRMVRGLDYYNRTTFELLTGELGSQNAVAAGGRYDGLVELLGGPAVPALGFAMGVERLVLMVGEEAGNRAAPGAYFVYRTDEGQRRAISLKRQLIGEGFKADMDYEERSLKAQMRAAGSSGAAFAVIFGESEIAGDKVTIKEMQTSEQVTLPDKEAKDYLIQRLRMESELGD
ncbi:MAG: histidine--tRNA ligase [Deltaproteobacteria bacterium]|nr:MAG: histidine--tRNA ligase [Deltaproteobacteria bacterium]